MSKMNGALENFTGNGNGAGIRMATGLRTLIMRGGSSGATFTWQVSFDREQAANDGAATWDTIARNAEGDPMTYVLAANATMALGFEVGDRDGWMRAVVSSHGGGGGTAIAGAR
jgi:hypothetical protein